MTLETGESTEDHVHSNLRDMVYWDIRMRSEFLVYNGANSVRFFTKLKFSKYLFFYLIPAKNAIFLCVCLNNI